MTNRSRDGIASLIAYCAIGALGIWLAARFLPNPLSAAALKTPVHGIVLGAAAITLGLSSVLVKEINDAFSQQLTRVASLSLQRQSSIVAYLSARRRDVILAWVLVGLSTFAASGASVALLAPPAKQALEPAVLRFITAFAYGLLLASVPAFARIVRYRLALDRFAFEITQEVREQEQRAATLGKIAKPNAPKAAAVVAAPPG